MEWEIFHSAEALGSHSKVTCKFNQSILGIVAIHSFTFLTGHVSESENLCKSSARLPSALQGESREGEYKNDDACDAN